MKKIERLFSAKVINGNYCQFHQITINDSKFIYDLRRSRSEYLYGTVNDIVSQDEYLSRYTKLFKNKQQIYYKVFDKITNKFTGVFRLTELDNNIKFNWQSAVFDVSSNPNCFIDTMLIVYGIGFKYLNRKICGPWIVNIKNKRVMKLHKLLGMTEIVNKCDKYYSIEIKKKNFLKNIKKYRKLSLGYFEIPKE